MGHAVYGMISIVHNGRRGRLLAAQQASLLEHQVLFLQIELEKDPLDTNSLTHLHPRE